ncbi:MAG: hypothetical protein KatS3mg042_1333 [Rhodothermaceae bacterium]|nr:MAG: hypothetical protein KatS3mg042_1333 [Rhodothermaceae bacterium]
MPATPPRLLTLTTDFGTRDAYVAAMKGTILSITPTVTLVDITHEIAPQDIMEAAFVLRDAVPYFPDGTVHLVVVDPGVGTDRRPVALRKGGHRFVGADNGLFPLLLDEGPDEAVVLDRPAFWRTSAPSNTFHGRDIFAPVAAHLAAGHALHEVGTPTDTLTPLHWALPLIDDQGVQGWVVHIDRFGNCITNIPRDALEQARAGRAVKCFAGTTILQGIHRTYGDVADGEPLALFGSHDFLEIAVRGGNAAELLGIRKGAPVHLVFA